MKRVMLDTNFILTCIKQKIDFFEEIKLMGMKILIPKQVINELKKIIKSKQKAHVRESAEIALKILSKAKFQKINLGRGHVDKLIIKFVKENPEIIVATLDKELKQKLKKKCVIIRNKKRIAIL